ncbi:MAG: FHA domain-containing serine/threonine-protein kinase [Clostridiales bacterium]|nr:FHA domain-containing serine/threonine-protein kinase [Clostridiales bacterium]
MCLRYENCPHCFARKNAGATCQVCGFQYNKVDSQPENVLPAFTMLNSRYLLGDCLGKGGFGITYSALDLEANVRCAIKEYFPSEFAGRNHETNAVFAVRKNAKTAEVFEHAKERFLDEARLLYRLRETPNVVKLYNFFSENNTAYIVMEFLDGSDLRKYAKKAGGKISFEMAVNIIDTCGKALSEVHNHGFLHRDVSPDNIFIRNSRQCVKPSDQYVVIDFGAARNYIGNNAATILLKPGFAPPEAYSKTGNRGPWTDVYSLAASIYNVLSGHQVVDALYKLRGAVQPTLIDLGLHVPKDFSDVIDAAMQIDIKKRPQSMDEFRQRVLASAGQFRNDSGQQETMAISTTGTPLPSSPPSPPSPPRKKCVGKLTIVDGPKRGASIKIRDGQTVTIGRSLQLSDFVVDYISEISREHCSAAFSEREQMLHLTDISVNGTYFSTNERLYRDRTYRLTPGQSFFLVRRDCMIMFTIEEEGV